MEDYKNTTRLQVSSLMNFARELGYIYSNGCFVFKKINRSGEDYSSEMFITFNRMVMFHNSEFILKDYNPKRFGVKQVKFMETIFCREDKAHAKLAKSVKRVKLQKCKYKVITQSHKIEFI